MQKIIIRTQAVFFALLVLPVWAGDGDGKLEPFLVHGWEKTEKHSGLLEDAGPLLGLVNHSTYRELTVHIGIDERAADNIVAYRLGDDGAAGTNDDESIDSLDELDRIPYVGPRTFRILAGHAVAHGFIKPCPPDSPFHEGSCGGPPMTARHAFRLIPLPDKTAAKIGTFSFFNRRRFGYEVDGTRPWENVLKLPVMPLFVRYSESFTDPGGRRPSLPEKALQGIIEVRLRDNKPLLVLRGNSFQIPGETADFWVEFVHNFSGVTAPAGEVYIARESGKKYASIEMPGLLHGLSIQKATLTEKCIRLETRWKYREKDNDLNDVYYEHENIVFGKIEP